MKTILLIGSPKPNPLESNTQLLAETFVGGMRFPCEIRRIAGSDYAELADYIRSFDTILLFFPLYVHAVPGIVMKLIEAMAPAEDGKNIGFFIQSGFCETDQTKFVTPYLKGLAIRLNYHYLGTVCKGDCAGLRTIPSMFRSVLQMVAQLGQTFEETGEFDPLLVTKMADPRQLSIAQLRILKLTGMLGIDNIFWHKMLKKHHAMKKRFDRPFITSPYCRQSDETEETT